MFVDLGGIDGLVNYNEISYKGPVNPANYYNEGDEVSVIVFYHMTKQNNIYHCLLKQHFQILGKRLKMN